MTTDGNTILMPLPARGFDPTEAAVTWKILTEHGHRVVVATPDTRAPRADPIMVTGRGLAILKGALRADKNGRAAYAQLSAAREFQAPLSYEQSAEARFDALVLPGGHAKEMRPYLESEVLQRIVVRAFHDGTLVAAICHGVLLAARSIDPETNLSVHRRISIPAPGARNAIRPKISPPASWFATAI
jgi:putative intracellular protease/amidase